MTPMLCVVFLRVKRRAEGRGFNSRFYVGYRALHLSSLRFRWRSLGVIGGVFAASLYGFGFVPQIFFPPGERPTFTVDLELPTGTPLSRSQTIVTEVEGFLRDRMLVGP